MNDNIFRSHWRDSARTIKFWIFDFRLVFSFLFFILHIRIWTFLFLVFQILFFSILEFYRLKFITFIYFLKTLISSKIIE